MINPAQLRDYVVTPALKEIGLYSKAAMRLVIGTAMTESRLEYLHQVGGGPALGLWQIEPKTHNDVWENYLLYRLPLAKKLNPFNVDYKDTNQLIWNLKYGAAICRIIYLRAPAPLPDENNIFGMAKYWKAVYNTELGAGKPEDFLNKAATVLEL